MGDTLPVDVDDSYLSDLIWLLKLGGFWFQSQPGRLGSLLPYLQISRIPMIVVIELVMAIGGMQIGPEYLRIPSSAYLTLGLVVIVMMLPFTIGHRRVLAFLQALKAGHSRLKLDWQHQLLKEECSRSQKLAIFYVTYTLTFTIFFPLVGFSIDTFHSIIGKEIYRYPLCLDIFDNDNKRTFKHFVVVFLSYAWLNLIATNNVSVIGSMFISAGFIKGRLRIVEGMLVRLPPGQIWNMQEIAAYHQEIIRMHNMFTDLMGFPFATQSIVGGINSCLIGICLLYQYMYSGAVMFVLVLSYFINFQVLLLLCGLEGETLQQQNEELSFAIYNLQWYDQPTDVKKSIIMMIRQSQKPLSLDYKGNVPLNLKTYSQIISSAYSYFNIYLQSLKDGL